MSEILKDQRVKARKPHVCSWCNKPILVGEDYRYQVQVDGGDFNQIHECDRCAPYFKEALDGDYWGSSDWLPESFITDYMLEEHGDIFNQWQEENKRLKEASNGFL